jgi:hypothetical protein
MAELRSRDCEVTFDLEQELRWTRWLAARAADAPDNFLHLLRLLEAEQGWAVGDFRAAVLAFRRRAARGRPAPAPVASGADRRTRGPLLSGPRRRTRRYDLLAQARQEYLAWGATAKVGRTPGSVSGW